MSGDGRGDEEHRASRRNETLDEKHDRNWGELVQELRVAQTGVQVLAGFLLTLPFSQRFASLDTSQKVLYLVAFSLAVLTVGLMTAPVALHRFLFGRHKKGVLVTMADRVAKAAMVAMGLTLVVVAVLIFSVVVDYTAAIVAGLLVLVFYATAWLVFPLALIRHVDEE
jgi:hypothetical protein